jgi:hypothetical protein
MLLIKLYFSYLTEMVTTVFFFYRGQERSFKGYYNTKKRLSLSKILDNTLFIMSISNSKQYV